MLAELGRNLQGWLGLKRRDLVANERGIRDYQEGDYKSAIRAFTEALIHLPDAPAYLANRGNARYALGDPVGADADLTRALNLCPLFDAYVCRGLARFELGKVEDALADYAEALRLDKSNPTVYFLRGHAWCEVNRFDEAWADYDSTLRLDSNNIGAWAMRGRMWDLLGQPDRALEDYAEVFRRDDRSPPVAVTFNNRGHIHYRRGGYDKAVADFTEALTRLPDFAHPYKNLAWLQATCTDAAYRDAAAAVANAQRAWALSKGQRKDWLDILAAAHAEAGQFDDALRWQEEALAHAAEEHRAEQMARLELYRAGRPYRDESKERLAREGIKEEWRLGKSDAIRQSV